MVTACVQAHAEAFQTCVYMCVRYVIRSFVHVEENVWWVPRYRLWTFFHTNKEQSPAYVFHISWGTRTHVCICGYSCGLMHFNTKEQLPPRYMCALKGIIIKSQTQVEALFTLKIMYHKGISLKVGARIRNVAACLNRTSQMQERRREWKNGRKKERKGKESSHPSSTSFPFHTMLL